MNSWEQVDLILMVVYISKARNESTSSLERSIEEGNCNYMVPVLVVKEL